MPPEIARQWFVPGDGIDRHVISADIQRYLGNDATVRPGVGNNEQQGVQGYWIKAYRNLTTAMIEDLKADSARWRAEQRQTGSRGSSSPYYNSDTPGAKKPDPFPEGYVGSNTYQNTRAAGRPPAGRRDGESPGLDGPYGVQPAARGDRMAQDSRMQIDPQSAQPRNPWPQDRSGYTPANPAYPDTRNYPPDSRPAYPMDNPMQAGYRPPVSQPYPQDPRYTSSSVYPQGTDGGAGQQYPGRPSNYYPVSSPYDGNPIVATTRPDPSQYGNGPYQQPQPGRDPREQRYPQQDYQEPRYAYPSPAATVSSVTVPREPMTSPAQQSNTYQPGPPGQYDQQYRGRRQYQ